MTHASMVSACSELRFGELHQSPVSSPSPVPRDGWIGRDSKWALGDKSG